MVEKISYDSTIASKVIDRLRRDIITGLFPVGSNITIKKISELYGVSYMPVREAIRALEGERLLSVVPYKGITIMSVDETFIRDMFGVLHALEVFMTEDAMKKIGPEEIEYLIKINDEVCALQDTEEDKRRYLDLNTMFHTAFFDWCGNSITKKLHAYYHSLVRILRSRYMHPYSRIQECARQHNDIIKAIQIKNEYLLKDACDRHVDDSMHCFMEQYQKENH